MNAYESYYTEKLYPLQDGVLRTLATAFGPNCDRAPFLTGGTALGRYYFNHRYSDDLDFFVSADPGYQEIVETALQALSRDFVIEPGSLMRSKAYSRIIISNDDIALKLDFVNDASAHFGAFATWDKYPKVDGLRNILSNKITAMYRLEPKDVADLREIALNMDFAWSELMEEAEAKEAGIDAPTIAELLLTFPEGMLETVRWRNQPMWKDFMSDLKIIALDLIAGSRNSLHTE